MIHSVANLIAAPATLHILEYHICQAVKRNNVTKLKSCEPTEEQVEKAYYKN